MGRKLTEVGTRKAALKIVAFLQEMGFEEIIIRTGEHSIGITWGENCIMWSIFEKVADITDKPCVTWRLVKNDCDDLEIELLDDDHPDINEKEEPQND